MSSSSPGMVFPTCTNGNLCSVGKAYNRTFLKKKKGNISEWLAYVAKE
jgi:hypothetical protein